MVGVPCGPVFFLATRVSIATRLAREFVRFVRVSRCLVPAFGPSTEQGFLRHYTAAWKHAPEPFRTQPRKLAKSCFF